MKSIEVEELARWRAEGKKFILLDVREPHEVETASISGSQHIPMGEIPTRYGELQSENEIVVMCHHGGRSERVAHYLEARGFARAYNLEGGIAQWSTRIDPGVPKY